MSRSFIHLRRALFGVSCAIVFGFGTTQAFAGPGTWPMTNVACPAKPYEYFTTVCTDYCHGPGYCDTTGYCYCGPIP